MLSVVQLAGLGPSGNQTYSMDDNFLAPLGHITNLFLDLSESHILHRNEKLTVSFGVYEGIAYQQTRPLSIMSV